MRFVSPMTESRGAILIASRSAESRRHPVIDKITLGGNPFDGVLNIEGIP